MRDWKGALEWYRTHQTTSQIGFNPDGMCLKVCRTARDIGPMFLTAKQAQDATPKEHRIYKVENFRRGMIAFFDDPNDSNTAGHIATMVGRIRGGDVDKLEDTLWETNSVVSGQLVVVRGDYFVEHWNDKLQFASTWLNGQVLDVPAKKKREPEEPAKTPLTPREKNFRDSRPEWDVKILDRAIDHGRRDLQQKVDAIDAAVKRLPDDDGDTRVKKFKKAYKEDRVLKMPLLNNAVADGRTGVVRDVRNQLRYVIKSVLR
jgi:hypothetical protein